jgi:hypothetical protein
MERQLRDERRDGVYRELTAIRHAGERRGRLPAMRDSIDADLTRWR